MRNCGRHDTRRELRDFTHVRRVLRAHDRCVPRDDPGSGRRVPAEVLVPTPEQQAEIDHRTAEAERFLQEVLGGSPVWLGAANAFVAAPTGRQLREIASSRLRRATRSE